MKQYPHAKQIDGLLAMRIDAPIYFANAIPIQEAISEYQRRTLRALTPRGIAQRCIILDISPVTDIEASAVHWLKLRQPLSPAPSQPAQCPMRAPKHCKDQKCASPVPR